MFNYFLQLRRCFPNIGGRWGVYIPQVSSAYVEYEKNDIEIKKNERQ